MGLVVTLVGVSTGPPQLLLLLPLLLMLSPSAHPRFILHHPFCIARFIFSPSPSALPLLLLLPSSDSVLRPLSSPPPLIPASLCIAHFSLPVLHSLPSPLPFFRFPRNPDYAPPHARGQGHPRRSL